MNGVTYALPLITLAKWLERFDKAIRYFSFDLLNCQVSFKSSFREYHNKCVDLDSFCTRVIRRKERKKD